MLRLLDEDAAVGVGQGLRAEGDAPAPERFIVAHVREELPGIGA